MILSPSDTFKIKEKYDLLIVDEAHRLRQYKNISWRKAFRDNNRKLGLDDSGNELDWIIANSKNQIFFYDSGQSIKPSDIPQSHFDRILAQKNTQRIELKSQMRVLGGNNYIKFVDDLMNVKGETKTKYNDRKYEVKIFNSISTLYGELAKREKEFGLCRILAGYSWPWKSNPKAKPKPPANTTDIELEGLHFKWNTRQNDWINSPTAFQEIGCIHTSQGYDLNYAAVVFGREIDYNPHTNEIIIYPEYYFDKNGKIDIKEPGDLKTFIINIYKTILCRGIRGTYVYAYHKSLRDYLSNFIQPYTQEFPFKILPLDRVKPYINSIPILDISVAAGNFIEQPDPSDLTWIEPPEGIKPKAGSFICKVVGESMNKIIPNGSYCLFTKDEGGSREGKIVLVECADIQDRDFGAGYTVKMYHSKKQTNEEGWSHVYIKLKPISSQDEFKDLIIKNDKIINFRIVGIFSRMIK